ncbi:MAG TPA: YceI family protein [Baekduia sp.]|nr:YceI family protein [Baekduia sp.]
MATTEMTADLSASGGEIPRLPQALGERIDIRPVVEGLRELIEASEPAMERDGELPAELAEALFQAGIFSAIHPREFGGLELHPIDWLDLAFELARINGSVAWLAVIQNGSMPLMAPDVMRELYAQGNGRFVPAGSHGRIGKAVPVDGGYRFTGLWAFASGAPWATHLTAFATVMGEDGEPLESPWGGPIYVDGIFPKHAVNYLGGWNSMGLRGTGSGQFSIDDGFLERRFVVENGGGHPAYEDRQLFGTGNPMSEGQSAMVLGAAQGAIDRFVALASSKVTRSSALNRAGRRGSEQLHQVQIARAHAAVRSAKAWTWDLAARKYAFTNTKDGVAQFALTQEALEAGLHACRIGKEAVNRVFDIAGTDSVIVGRGIERCFRDVHTAGQHTLNLESNFEITGQYLLTKDRPEGPTITSELYIFGPPPLTGDAARQWLLDPIHSTVGFRVRHHAVGTFRGYFDRFEAVYDAEAGTLRGSAKTASLDVFDGLKEHLLGPDFLAADTYPEVSFESTSVAIDGDQVTVSGDLTLKGVTKAVTASGTFSGPSRVPGMGGGPDSEHIGLDLEITIDRREFGIEFNNELLDGQENLGWDVTLDFSLEFGRPVAESEQVPMINLRGI